MNSNLSSKDILELAISKHKKQDLSGAEKLYQEVLKKDDSNFNANFLLGTLFASNIQVRKPIFKDSLNTYLNYKKFLDKYGTRYSWWSR